MARKNLCTGFVRQAITQKIGYSLQNTLAVNYCLSIAAKKGGATCSYRKVRNKFLSVLTCTKVHESDMV